MACTTFSPIATISKPAWALSPSNPATWSVVPPITTFVGFGFGQGGFGQGSFGGSGTQAGTATPNWVVLGTAFASVYNEIAMFDSAGKLWSVTVLPTGNLFTAPAGSLPIPSFFPPTTIVMVDSSGAFWNLTILTTGNLVTTPVTLSGTDVHSTSVIQLVDSNCRIWKLTVLTTGNLVTT